MVSVCLSACAGTCACARVCVCMYVYNLLITFERLTDLNETCDIRKGSTELKLPGLIASGRAPIFPAGGVRRRIGVARGNRFLGRAVTPDGYAGHYRHAIDGPALYDEL
ncbi:hypothetical protein EVAR_53415_1 [Eumeta japonica]|uniref:Uncharacterized protein n=1 Tax=Eumeta variegata TaxID=151549 RepID=A0A4C1XQQ2_EUMVA|nr:hypothetical protein EVAR_53415_1 [Eumeta japonica]